MERYYYLLLMLFTLSYPLAQSFEHRIQYAKKLYALVPAIVLMALVFISWDHWFTVAGVWGFNPRYVLGVYGLGLPVEEWAFFLVVPYACVFIYEVMNYYVKKDILRPFANYVMLLLILSFLLVGLTHSDKLYTFVNFLFAASMLALHFLMFKNKHFGRFLLAYFVTLIPFLLVNGVLTGSWIEEPIVYYNDAQILGIRIGTIPVEDSVYNLSMLLMVVTIYEKLREKKTIQQAVSL